MKRMAQKLCKYITHCLGFSREIEPVGYISLYMYIYVTTYIWGISSYNCGYTTRKLENLKVGGIIWIQRPETHRGQWHKFQTQSKGPRISRRIRSNDVYEQNMDVPEQMYPSSTILFCLSPQWLDDPSTLVRALFLTQFANSMVISSGNTFTNISGNNILSAMGACLANQIDT